MESDRFDALTARLAGTLSRRRTVGLLAALGIAGAGAANDADAKKKKKKKCKGCTECQACKKGKCKPKPEGSACIGGLCNGGGCACFNGFKACQGRCIPDDQCCTSADCGSGGTCQSGTCICGGGSKRCGNQCIPAANCCGDSDCTGGRTCLSGSCAFTCPTGDCPASCACWGALPNNVDVCAQIVPDPCSRSACDANGGCGSGQGCAQFTCDADPLSDGRCVPLC